MSDGERGGERWIERDVARLRLLDGGGPGMPVLFQHGLGGGEDQVRGVFPDDGPYRRVTLECRAQGRSTAGDARPFTLAMLAADVLAAADAAGLDRFVAGGISMGAAIALRLAARHPDRVSALILVRPSFLFDPAPANMRPFAAVADCLRYPPAAARQRFEASETAAMLAEKGPDNLQSLLSFFDRPDPLVTADLLDGIAGDGPDVSRETLCRIGVPTLVVGNALDFVHPPEFARELAAAIPGAVHVEAASKTRDPAAHAAGVRAAIRRFLDASPHRNSAP